jgi:hypothetical protein
MLPGYPLTDAAHLVHRVCRFIRNTGINPPDHDPFMDLIQLYASQRYPL